MSVVPYDKELEALEEEERKVDLEITKQEKSQQIAEKRRKLEELSSAGSSSSTAAVPTVTRTATLTVKTSKVRRISFRLGSVKRQRQSCNNCAMTLAISLSLKTMQSLQNGVATHFRVTPLYSVRTESLLSLQSCRSVDADARCKRA